MLKSRWFRVLIVVIVVAYLAFLSVHLRRMVDPALSSATTWE